MNRRRLLQSAAAALLAPAAARALPAPQLAKAAGFAELDAPSVELYGMPRLSAARGGIRYATPGALSAAGGLCMPVEPYYPLVELEVENPVRATMRASSDA